MFVSVDTSLQEHHHVENLKPCMINMFEFLDR